ncbi:hypothetical protein [Agromyces sp. ZXT2-3]|uniref:hypothetical protein n=1 Tax=Agromyces sp. ZXT2-3 TaxID=3461152 RepID=UPI004054AF46
MTLTGYGFHFEAQGRGGYEGPNIPAAEHFSGTDIEQALAREFIQNSLDAKAKGESIVEVDFDLQSMPVDQIPGVDQLREVLPRVVKITEDEQLEGRDALSAALTSVRSEHVPVLCVGDSGTRGLTGSESIDDQFSPLSVLTRSVGASAGDEDRGGSFGIGSSVGVLASRMRTVAYVTKAIDKDEPVLAATTRLAGFRDGDGVLRLGTGHLTNLAVEHDLEYPKGIDRIGPFVPRVSNGTDVYVLDYVGAGAADGLRTIKRSAAENFWAAIHEGRLIVRGSTDDGDWVLSADTLEDELVADEILAESTLPFYRAFRDGQVKAARLTTVGDVELRVTTLDVPDRFRATQLMRKPLMKVENIRHQVVSVPYAAVFVCRDEKGNELLRSIEPPAHDRWNARGRRSNGAAVKQIKDFIREALRELVPASLGDRAEVRGLARFLPARLTGPTPPSTDGAHDATDGRESDREGRAIVGRPDVGTHREWKPNTAVSLPAHAIADEGGPAGQTGVSGGSGTHRTSGGRRDTQATAGDGRSRIRSSDVRFRAFRPAGASHTTIVLTSPEELRGDLALRAVGGGGSEAFEPGIESAFVVRGAERSPVKATAAALRDLHLEPEVPLVIEVDFSYADRYRLGVSDG